MPLTREPSPTPGRAAWRRRGVAVASLRASLADRKAGLLRRWVAGAPDQRLESVMRGHLRRALLWQIFRTMRQRVDGRLPSGTDAVIEFTISRPDGRVPDRYEVVVANGRCTTTRHGDHRPTVALAMDSVSFLRLVTGTTGVAALLLRRRLRVRGDFLLAARLPGLLRIPRAPEEHP